MPHSTQLDNERTTTLIAANKPSISTKRDGCSVSTMWLRWFRPAPRTSVWNTRPLTESSFPRTDVLWAAIRSRKSRTVRLLQV